MQVAGILARAVRRHPVAGVLFLALAGAFLVLTLRALVMALVWAASSPDPDAPIAGWMTPRYVVRLRDVPPDAMRRILDLPAGEGTRVTLEQLAAARGVPLDQFLAELEAAIVAARPAP
jgi:hypothetical protein